MNYGLSEALLPNYKINLLPRSKSLMVLSSVFFHSLSCLVRTLFLRLSRGESEDLLRGTQHMLLRPESEKLILTQQIQSSVKLMSWRLCGLQIFVYAFMGELFGLSSNVSYCTGSHMYLFVLFSTHIIHVLYFTVPLWIQTRKWCVHCHRFVHSNNGKILPHQLGSP